MQTELTEERWYICFASKMSPCRVTGITAGGGKKNVFIKIIMITIWWVLFWLFSRPRSPFNLDFLINEKMYIRCFEPFLISKQRVYPRQPGEVTLNVNKMWPQYLSVQQCTPHISHKATRKHPIRCETSTPWAQPTYHGGRPGDAHTVLMCICEWRTIQFSVRVHLRIATVPLPSIASVPSAPTGWLVGWLIMSTRR